MSEKPFTVTREHGRELKRIIENVSRGHRVPHAVVRQRMLDDMATDLRKLAETYERTGRRAKELLDCLVIAEAEGVDASVLKEIKRDLRQRAMKRRAA